MNMKIPFTKAIIIRHTKGDRRKISFYRTTNPFKITVFRVGRIVFYSNWEVVGKVLDENFNSPIK